LDNFLRVTKLQRRKATKVFHQTEIKNFVALRLRGKTTKKEAFSAFIC
jgi:hypothetical protein